MTRLEPIKPTVRWALAHGLPSVLMRVAARRGDVQGRLITSGVIVAVASSSVKRRPLSNGIPNAAK